LEATGYLTPKAARGPAPRPAVVEDLDEVTNLVLQGPPASRPAAARAVFTATAQSSAHRPGPQARAAVRARGAACAPSPEVGAADQPRHLLRHALDLLTCEERTLLLEQWQDRDARRQSLLRVLLAEDDQPPPRGDLSAHAQLLRRAEARLRQALAGRRDLLRALGPERLGQFLREEHPGAGTNGRASGPFSPPPPGEAARTKRRPAGDPEVYQRVSRSLFQLLNEIEIPLPARDEAGEATRLLRHLVGREALAHFRELTCWLHAARGHLDLAGDPSFYAARDRLLLWLAPECFLTDGRQPRFELSFRLYLRARLKDYCRRKGWAPAGPRYHDLETAFRALDRQRIGDIVREAVEEAARVEDEAAALVGVPLAQALQWLQLAP
jgi:hypothetical protein